MTRWSRGGRRAQRSSTWEHVSFWVALAAVVCVLVATVALTTTDVLQPSRLLATGADSSPTPRPSAAAPSSTPAQPSEQPVASASLPTTSAPVTPIKPKLPTVEALDALMARRGLTRVPPSAWNPLAFTTASFNVLGASHTRGRGARKGYAVAERRLPAQLAMLGQRDVSVAGLQEFQYPQVRQLLGSFGGAYEVYPGLELGNWLADNSIMWRTADWEAVQKRTIEIPYFRGRMTPMPYVLLRHKETGRTVWFANFHNPANVAGDARRFREQAVAIEADLAVRLGQDGTPVIVTGDMNDRLEFGCPFARASGMWSANGVAHEGGQCRAPRQLDVDWIFGSRSLSFAGFSSDDTTRRRRLSDHPLISAAVTLPGVQQRPGCVPRLARSGAVWYCRAA